MQASQQPSPKDFSLLKEGASSLLMLKDLLLSPRDEHGRALAIAATHSSALPLQGQCRVLVQQLFPARACGSLSGCLAWLCIPCGAMLLRSCSCEQACRSLSRRHGLTAAQAGRTTLWRPKRACASAMSCWHVSIPGGAARRAGTSPAMHPLR